MWELADLLMTMGEAWDDVANKKDEKSAKEKRREKDKKRIGASIISAATYRRNIEDDISEE